MSMRTALVLGGGGVAGIAWQTGILAGLAESERSLRSEASNTALPPRNEVAEPPSPSLRGDGSGGDVLDADLVVGTSAGSTVGAQVTSGLSIADLFARQVDPALQVRELPADVDMETFTRTMAELLAGAPDPAEIRRRVGAWALRTPTVAESVRRKVIAARLPAHDWPRRPLMVVAVDAHTGQRRVFDRESTVDLVDAVAASCAVPGTWPPVTIAGNRYIDGGVHSNENADLASGYDRVVVLSPLPPELAALPWIRLDQEVELLRRQGSEVVVVRPDEASLAAMGPNLLDPAVRAPAAHAGRAQGRRLPG